MLDERGWWHLPTRMCRMYTRPWGPCPTSWARPLKGSGETHYSCLVGSSVPTTGLALVQVCRMKRKERMLASDPHCSRAAGRGLEGGTMGGSFAHLCAQRLHISDQRAGRDTQHIAQGSCKPLGACCPQGTACAVTPAVPSMTEILLSNLFPRCKLFWLLTPLASFSKVHFLSPETNTSHPVAKLFSAISRNVSW